MPKLKTKSGAKKRFKITASGKVKYQQTGKRHQRAVQVRRRQHQEVLAAERLTGLSRAACRRLSLVIYSHVRQGDFPWPA